jgi:hypothetical protein
MINLFLPSPLIITLQSPLQNFHQFQRFYLESIFTNLLLSIPPLPILPKQIFFPPWHALNQIPQAKPTQNSLLNLQPSKPRVIPIFNHSMMPCTLYPCLTNLTVNPAFTDTINIRSSHLRTIFTLTLF